MEKHYERSQELREERAAVAYELEKEKHVLRQMQGRRYEGQSPGQYRTTRNPQHPVLVQGHWQEAPLGELQKHDIVHQLQVRHSTCVCVWKESFGYSQNSIKIDKITGDRYHLDQGFKEVKYLSVCKHLLFEYRFSPF